MSLVITPDRHRGTNTGSRASLMLLTCVAALVTTIALLRAAAIVGDAPIGGEAPGGGQPSFATDAVVRDFYDAINGALISGDTTALESITGADLIVHTAARGVAPDRTGLARSVAAVRARMPGVRLVVEDVVVVGDRAIVGVGQFGGVKGSFLGRGLGGGSRVWGRFDAVRVADGRVAEYWGDPDGLALLEPLLQVPLGTVKPIRQMVALERISIPLAGYQVAGLAAASRVIYVQEGSLRVAVDAATTDPATAITRSGSDAAQVTDVEPGTDRVLAAGQAAVLPAAAGYRLRSEGGLLSPTLLSVVLPGHLYIGPLRPAVPQFPGQATDEVQAEAGMKSQILAGGPSTTVPPNAIVSFGRVTLGPGATVRLDEAA